MAKPSKIVIISTLLLFVIGLVGCGKKLVELGNTNANQNLNQNVNQNQNANLNANIATTSGEIDTKNWKIYKNEEYWFEFRYPGDWNLFINEGTGNSWETYKIKPLTLVEIKNIKKDKEIFCTLGGPIAPPEGMSVKFSVEKLLSIYNSFDKIIQNCDSNTESGRCIARIESFNNNKVLIIDDSMSPCDSFPKAYVIKNNYKYFLDSIWYYENGKNYNYLRNLFYKIIETVRIN